MTKHNAEMENSREQSQVCARLPLQIQLFAEEPAKQEQIPTQRGQRATPAPVSVIAAMVKRAAAAFWFLQSVHFHCPDDCLKTGLFCLSEYKILLLRCMMTDFG